MLLARITPGATACPGPRTCRLAASGPGGGGVTRRRSGKATHRPRATDTDAPPPPAAAASSSDSSSSSGSGEGPKPWAAPGYLGAVVSSMPLEQQRVVFLSIVAALGAGTALCAGVLGPAVSTHLPSFLRVTRTSWFPLGPIFVAAGVAHFTEEKGFCSMMPHQGAWGLWYLPGSDRFHVYWTGVAEVLGGLGLCLGALPFDFVPAWLSPASAFGLFALTCCVSPSNAYMYTHNAPGPVPESVAPGALPWQGHLARGLMQVLLLSTLWGIATASS